MSKWRKKPIIVEAIKIAELLGYFKNDWNRLPQYVQNAYNNGKIFVFPNCLEIKTLEGLMIGNLKDWLIQGIACELYPCRPEIFLKTYTLGMVLCSPLILFHTTVLRKEFTAIR